MRRVCATSDGSTSRNLRGESLTADLGLHNLGTLGSGVRQRDQRLGSTVLRLFLPAGRMPIE